MSDGRIRSEKEGSRVGCSSYIGNGSREVLRRYPGAWCMIGEVVLGIETSL